MNGNRGALKRREELIKKRIHIPSVLSRDKEWIVLRLNLYAHSLQEIKILLKSTDPFFRKLHFLIRKKEISFFARPSIISDPLRRTGEKREEAALQNTVKIEDQIKFLPPEGLNECSNLSDRPP